MEITHFQLRNAQRFERRCSVIVSERIDEDFLADQDFDAGLSSGRSNSHEKGRSGERFNC